MEESDRSINTESETVNVNTRKRVESFFERMQEDNLTLREAVALSAFLLSLTGLLTNVKLFRSLAKIIFDSIIDMEVSGTISALDYNLNDHGISHRNDVDRKSKEVPTDTARNEGINSSIQSEKSQESSPSSETGTSSE